MFEFPHCMACGRQPPYERPDGWWAPWELHKAHLFAGSGRGIRRPDRRYVILLCAMCHKLHRHTPGTVTLMGREFVGLTDANAIWIKYKRDGAYYDAGAIATVWLGNPPAPVEPDEWFQRQYEQRQGAGPPQGIEYTSVYQQGFRVGG